MAASGAHARSSSICKIAALSLACMLTFLVRCRDPAACCGSHAAPTAPDLGSCHLPYNIPPAESPLQCCPPGIAASTSPPPLFRPSPPSSLRVRRPAHLATPAYAAQLARAYSLMKALPADDPRAFHHQANIHCAYCNSAYNQLNSSQLLQVHGCWLFSPFHRWYLYFHERILAKLVGDATFALTFWNYDHPNGSSLPWLFQSFDEDLGSIFRDPLHDDSNATVSVDSPIASDDRTSDQQLQANLFAIQRAVVRDAVTQDGFFGWPLRQGDDPFPGAGALERIPHNSVHEWLGNKTDLGLKDMGSFYAAARDPVFYAHHAQLDRLWEIWKTLPDHLDIADPDYLDSEFAFYNEDAELVRVRVGDSLNASLLGFTYEEVETPWMNAVPIRCSTGIAELSSNATICAKGEPIIVPCSVVVERPEVYVSKPLKLSTSDALDWLSLTVQLDMTRIGARVDLYVNLPEAEANTSPACLELVGTFSSLTPEATFATETYSNRTTLFTLYGRLLDLKLSDQESVVITLVPIFPKHSSLPEASEPLIYESCSIIDEADVATATRQ